MTLKDQFKFLFLSAISILFVVPQISGQINQPLEEKVQVFMDSNTPQGQYDALLELMEFNSNLNLQEVEKYFELFTSKSYTNRNHRYPIIAHYLAADVLYYNDLKDSSLYHYLSLANSAKLQNENMLAVSGLGNAAYVLSELGDKIAALNLLKQNIHIAKQTGDKRDLSDYNYNIASYYSDLGIQDSAIHYFEKTIDLDRVIQNESGMVYNMHTLLDQYLSSKSLSKAQNLCEECINIAQKIKDNKALSTCYFYLAKTAILDRNFTQAEIAIEQAINIDSERKDATRLSKYLNVRANVYVNQKRNEEAESNYKLAISAAEKNQIQADIIDSKLGYAKFQSNIGKHKSALAILSRLEELVSNNNLLPFKKELFAQYEDIYARQGNFKKVSEYQALQIDLLNKQVESKNLLATDQSKNSYDLFKLENTNRLLTAEKQLADVKLKRRNTLIIFSLLFFILIAGLAYFFFQSQRQKNKIKANKLEFQIIEKELFALRSQMNPHFLFNSLNSINDYIIHEEPRKASRYLTKFSSLMRTILNNSKEKLITLQNELNANKLYIEMENLRFNEKFEYRANIDPDINPNKVLIPAMLMQPFFENAIKHGLRNSSKAGILSLEIMKDKKNLVIEITDNGIGRKEAARLNSKRVKDHESMAMGITENRIDLLNQIHNVDAQLEVIDLENPTGTKILIRIKYLSTDKSDS